MAQIASSLFKKYDIRGKAIGDDALLTPEVARLIGSAFGTYLDRVEGMRACIVGRDNRHSSPALAAALIEGLQMTGCKVFDLRLASTPLVYWHAVNRGDIGGVMVTGSHLRPDQNGFKLCVGARNLWGDGIDLLREMIAAGNSNSGFETVTPIDNPIIAT